MNLVERFSIDLEEKIFECHTFNFNNCCYIWIGDLNLATMSSLVVAMPTKFDTIPLSSILLSQDSDSNDINSSIAQRISKKFNRQCFISCNIPLEDQHLIQQVERVLFHHLNEIFQRNS